jgi:LemA protein
VDPLLLLAVAAAALVVTAALAYNRLVRMRNLVRNAWSDVDVQLRRRSDLVPALVEVVKGYVGHERNVLEEVTVARAHAEAAAAPQERAAAERELVGRLTRLIALAEDYPELKASHQFGELHRQLTAIEEDLASARKYYNGAAADYRTLLQSFPLVLVARPMGFVAAELFAAEGEARVTPAVEIAA